MTISALSFDKFSLRLINSVARGEIVAVSIVSMNARFLLFAFLYFTARLRHGRSEERILNGSRTNIISAPYMLSFMLNGQHACGAAIINRHWAVTAAHCVKAAGHSDEISVLSGSSVLYDGVIHNAIDVRTHEKYKEMINDYDIAVIKVTPPFAYSNSTKPVNVARGGAQEIFTESGVVCGWGYYLKFDGVIDPVLPSDLQCVQVPLIEKRQCQKDYECRYTLTPRMTCYGFQEGTVDSCKGDSGGALVNRDNILLGITSWGDGCGEMYSPGVYSDAIILQDWIRNETRMI